MRLTPVYFAVLLIALFGLTLLVAPALAQTTATATVQPTVPVITPVLTLTPTYPVLLVTPATGCSAPLPLVIAGLATVRGGVNVRAIPSVSGALLNYFAEEKLVQVIDGPVCANGYNWWRVAGVGEPGWVIEGRPGRYLMQGIADPNTINCFPPQSGIRVNGSVIAITGSRVREETNINSRVITVAQAGTVMTVLEGPRCFDGMIWWRVRTRFEVTDTLVEGWVGEGYPGEYWIGPADSPNATGTSIPCARPLSWRLGTRAAVTYSDGVPRRLRAQPSTGGALVEELLDGVAFEVIDGTPVCSGGYNWWNVRILTTGITGWIAEGTPAGYWVQVIAQ
jgi:hypothetical protein